MKGDEDEAVEGGWEESQRGMRFADPLPSSGRPVRARAGMGGVSLSLSRPCVCARLSALVLPSRERAVARESSVCCCVRSGQCARLRKQKQKKISFSLSATRHLKKNINRFVSVAAAGHKQPGGHVNSLTTLVWNIVPEPARIVCVWRVLCKEKRRDLLFYCRAQLLTHTHTDGSSFFFWATDSLTHLHTHTHTQDTNTTAAASAARRHTRTVRACASLRAGEYQQDQTQNTHIKRRRIFFFLFPPFSFSLSLCVCVPTLHGAYPRTGAKIAAVRYDNSDIAASAYGKMTMVRLCFFVQKFLTVTTALNRFRAICCCVWPKKKTIMIAGRPSLNAPIVCLCRLSATVVPMTGVVVSRKEKPTGFPFPSRNWKTLVRSPSFVGICQLARPSKEREKKNKSVGEECDSTLLVPLASSRTMHFLHPLPPSPKKNLFYR